MDIELKPCPFCGGEGKIRHKTSTMNGNINSTWIECNQCKAATKLFGVSNKYASDKEAAKAWNSRVPSQDFKVVNTVYGDNQPVVSYETDGKTCHNCKHFIDYITSPVGFSCKHCSRFHLDRYEEDKDE